MERSDAVDKWKASWLIVYSVSWLYSGPQGRSACAVVSH